MVSIPGFLLRRLYVRGSLRSNRTGFQFELKNSLGSGYARKLLPLTVDDQEIDVNCCSLTIDDKRIPFSTVSEEVPFTLAMNRTITIQIERSSLSAGTHKISMGFVVAGLGILRFDFTDTLSDD